MRRMGECARRAGDAYGSPWFFSGTSDVRWDDDELNQLKALRGSDFEVVDTSGFVNGP